MRSSCEASEVNRACWSKAASRRAKVEFRTPANRPSSLSVSAALMRWDKSPSAILTAVALIASIGRMARVATHQPPTKPSSSTVAPAAVSHSARRRMAARSGTSERPTRRHCPCGRKRYASRIWPRVRASGGRPGPGMPGEPFPKASRPWSPCGSGEPTRVGAGTLSGAPGERATTAPSPCHRI